MGMTVEGFTPDCGGDKEPTHIMVHPGVRIFHDLNVDGACQDFVLDAEMGTLWPEDDWIGPAAIRKIGREFERTKRGQGTSAYWRFVIDNDGNILDRT